MKSRTYTVAHMRLPMNAAAVALSALQIAKKDGALTSHGKRLLTSVKSALDSVKPKKDKGIVIEADETALEELAVGVAAYIDQCEADGVSAKGSKPIVRRVTRALGRFGQVVH